MSAPTPSQGITIACQLLSGRRLETGEVQALLAATGSREELVAHLIVDWRVLEAVEPARDALQTQVMAVRFSGSRPATEVVPPAWPDEMSQIESVKRLDRFVCQPGDEDVASLLLELGPPAKTGRTAR